MPSYRSLLDYIGLPVVQRLPERLRTLWETVEVSESDESEAVCRVRASCIEDWWFCWIEGHGSVRIRDTGRSPPADDYAILALMMGGRNWLKGEKSPIRRPGEIALYVWDGPYSIVSSGEFRYLIAHIPKRDLESVADAGTPVLYGRPISSQVGAGAVLAATLRALATEAIYVRDAVKLGGLLPDFARLAVHSFTQPDDFVNAPTNHARVSRILDYLEAHHSDTRLHPAAVARACGVSERQLYRGFAAEGLTFANSLRQIRLDAAMARLTTSMSESLTDIAYSCGFSSPGHFSRVFRAAHGRTPSMFRREAFRKAESVDRTNVHASEPEPDAQRGS